MRGTAARLERLEETYSNGGECPHGWRIVHVRENEPEAGPERCEICNLLKPVILVRYVEGMSRETQREIE